MSKWNLQHKMVLIFLDVGNHSFHPWIWSQDVPSSGDLGLEESEDPWNTIPLKKEGMEESAEEIEDDGVEGWPDADGSPVSPWVEENKEPVVTPWQAEDGFPQAPWVIREER